MNASTILIIVLMLATFSVMILGLALMTRGGKINKKYSNKLMQARIWLQGITIATLLLVLLSNK